MKLSFSKYLIGTFILSSLIIIPVSVSAEQASQSMGSHPRNPALHGSHAHGTIVSVAEGSFTISYRKGKDMTDTVSVFTGDKTQFGASRTTASTLAVGDTVNIIGASNIDGSIQASFVSAHAQMRTMQNSQPHGPHARMLKN